MPDPCGFVVKNGTNRFALLAMPGPSSSTMSATRAILPLPTNAHAAARLERRVDRVAHQVDQQLIELIAVGAHASSPDPATTLTGIRVSSAATRRTHVPTSSGTRCSAPAVAPVARTPT